MNSLSSCLSSLVTLPRNLKGFRVQIDNYAVIFSCIRGYMYIYI